MFVSRSHEFHRDPIRTIEKQSGFLRLLLYLDEHGEQSVTEILDRSGIFVHQLYVCIEMARNWKSVSSRIDKSSYPNRNLIGITGKGRKTALQLRLFLILVAEA